MIVLNKADLAPTSRARSPRSSPRLGVPVHAVSAETGEGVKGLLPHLAGGRTAALLGSSGVGKSTIINRLIGEERFRPTRSALTAGAHTTSHRELVAIPGGGVIIDTPGLRELQLWETDGGLDQTFVDVADLIAQCRFSDCEHRTEPGCAIKAALADGTLPRERWESYLKLQRELAHLERKLDPKLGGGAKALGSVFEVPSAAAKGRRPLNGSDPVGSPATRIPGAARRPVRLRADGTAPVGGDRVDRSRRDGSRRRIAASPREHTNPAPSGAPRLRRAKRNSRSKGVLGEPGVPPPFFVLQRLEDVQP